MLVFAMFVTRKCNQQEQTQKEQANQDSMSDNWTSRFNTNRIDENTTTTSIIVITRMSTITSSCYQTVVVLFSLIRLVLKQLL